MELPNVGKQCSLSQCQQIDFLPIKCEKCLRWFCGEHISLHGCGQLESVVQSKILDPQSNSDKIDDSNLVREFCPLPACKVSLLNMKWSTCDDCNQKFCLKHRNKLDHNCISADLQSLVKQNQKSQVNALLQKNGLPEIESSSSSTNKQTKQRATSKASSNPKVELIRTKMKAKGDQSIPMDQRLFIKCRQFAEDDSTIKYLFVSKKCTMGKFIDIVASTCQIRNVNNSLADDQTGERLVLKLADGSLIGETVDNRLTLPVSDFTQQADSITIGKLEQFQS
ncbi:hypothetical protein MIR68_010207 [Amoeboaphelidium protococcarum]|nr:hypothetical protein MIR68_010207 [Amoeboaphelidium protococcarum]